MKMNSIMAFPFHAWNTRLIPKPELLGVVLTASATYASIGLPHGVDPQKTSRYVSVTVPGSPISTLTYFISITCYQKKSLSCLWSTNKCCSLAMLSELSAHAQSEENYFTGQWLFSGYFKVSFKLHLCYQILSYLTAIQEPKMPIAIYLEPAPKKDLQLFRGSAFFLQELSPIAGRCCLPSR